MADLFGRTEVEAHLAQQEFERALGLPRVEDDTARQLSDARYSPGDEPKRLAHAKPRATPSSETARRLYGALASPVKLGFLSNAIMYSSALRRLSKPERQALYGLVKGGALVVLRVGPPDELWLVQEARRKL